MKQSLQFKIELFGAKKSIWRRFVVPETISLKKFHEVIQVVMGWENYHLYSFTFGREIFSAWTEEEEENAEKKLTKEIIARFFAKRGACGQYEYDPGDGWSLCWKISARPGSRSIFVLTEQWLVRRKMSAACTDTRTSARKSRLGRLGKL